MENSSRIQLVKRGITSISADIIVNAANEGLWEGGGVCGAIFQAAGSLKLTKACQEIGYCKTGNVVKTPAFNLHAKYIFHAVGPIWQDGNHGEPSQLYDCYRKSLEMAKANQCHSIVFPLISAGIFGYPKDKAWRKAFQGCQNFIRKNPDYYMQIYFAVPNDRIRSIGEQILSEIRKQANAESERVSLNKLTIGQKQAVERGQAEARGNTVIQENEAASEITFFWHENQSNGCFSQWYPCVFEVEGIRYESAEQYMMAKKALLCRDLRSYELIMSEPDPKTCKKLGKGITPFNEAAWNQTKVEIVYNGNLAKFRQNKELKEALCKTGSTIIAEASPYDIVWGIGLAASDPAAKNPKQWNGDNLLGRVLMQVRAELAKEKIPEGNTHAGNIKENTKK